MIGSQETKGGMNTIVRACRLIPRMSGSNPDFKESHRIYYSMLADYYSRLLKAEEEGNFIAAHTIFFPVEILHAMNIVPMHIEITSWMSALFSGNCANLLSASSEVGLAPEICSPYRVLTGALSKNTIPRPDVILWTNLICDNAAKSGELVMHMADCPGFLVDCPFQQTDEEKAYLKKEFEEMIDFLEKQSGQKMDWNRLSENVGRTDEQIELYREINQLRQNIPSPFPSQDFLKLFTVDCLFSGQPEAIEYLEAVRREMTERICVSEENSSRERFRVMNIGMPPILYLAVIDRISQEYGVVAVADPLFCNWPEGRLDPQQPLDSVLNKISMNPIMVMYGPLDERIIKTIVDCAIQYKTDGAIYYAHVACRQSAALIKLLKDTLNEIDIPVLILDCDVIDTTVTPEEEMSKKLEQFYELLEDR